MRSPLVLGSCVLSVAMSIAAQAPTGPFRTKALFGDHMVVPAQSRIVLRGDGAHGGTVRAKTSWGAESSATTGEHGAWQVTVPTPARGTVGEITLTHGDARLVLRDVLVGDVWLCGGQSNMEMPLGKHWWSQGVRDHEAVIAAADLPQLRVFTVKQRTAEQPGGDIEGQWQVCSPTTAATFSATAFFFGRDLVAAGKGPIGLVVSCWGGTVAEAWVRDSGLAAFPEFAAELAARAGGNQPALAALRQGFWAAVPVQAPTGQQLLVQVPDLWSNSGLKDFDGVAYYERALELPAPFRGQDCWLELGALDDMDTVFWGDARLAGNEDDGAWSTARRYAVPAARTDVAATKLRVRLVDTGGEGGFSGKPDELRLVLASDPSQVLPLAGAWLRTTGPSLDTLPKWPRSDHGPNRPAVLWNGMIAPLLPFPFTGAIWYQGESNRHRDQQYVRLFRGLIEDWRRAIGTPLPFFFVQIAPYGYGDERGDITPRLRQAQAAALLLPRTGMAVTLDVGDAGDIHPIDKGPVGARLARLALARHYGEDVVCDGPIAVSARAEGAQVTIAFAEPGHGLELRNDGAGFELAGSDGRFVPARARVVGATIVLEAADVPAPTAMRYAWAAVPGWSLVDSLGLPAAPFRFTW